MGSFNVSCALTNLSISGGDECYFIPLALDQYHDNADLYTGASSFVCSNEISEAFFRVALLPIKGTYSDCAHMNNIEENDNTRFIEKTFDTNIDDFIDNITKFNDPYNSKKTLRGCYIHKFAYNKAVKYMMDEGYDGHSIFNYDLSEKIIKYIGFEFSHENDDKRYKRSYTINGIKDWEIRTDGSYSNIINVKTKEEFTAYRVSQLKENWKEYTGEELILSKSDEELKNTHYYDLVFQEEVEALGEEKDLRNKLDDLNVQFEAMEDEESREALKIKADIILTEHSILMSEFKKETAMYRRGIFSKTYQELFKVNSQDIKKLIGECISLRIFMYLNCRLFQPTSLGPQCGEPRAEKALLEAALGHVNDEIEKREE